MCADTGIEADALDDSLWIKAFDFSIGVEFVEVRDTKSKVCVGKEFYSLGLFHAHKQGGDVFLLRSLAQQGGEGLGSALHATHVCHLAYRDILGLKLRAADYLGAAHDDAAGIEVVVEGLALP